MSPAVATHALALLLLLPLPCAPAVAVAVRFADVTRAAGLSQPAGKQLKYGGAMLADVDADGWLDILLLSHNSAPADLYFSNAGLNYTRADWHVGGDVHGSTAFRYSAHRRAMSLVVQRGGGWGYHPKPPHLFDVNARKRTIIRASPAIPDAAGARGRSACALSLRRTGSTFRPDLLLSSASMPDGRPHQRALQLTAGNRPAVRAVKGPLAVATGEFVNVVDVDGDGRVEVVSFHDLRIFQVAGDFWLREVTDAVLPKQRQASSSSSSRRADPLQWRGVSAVAELDVDNDGRWDLYVARTTQQNLHWLPRSLRTDDVLLRNAGGRFDDVSVSAGVTPHLDGFSRGVTVGDFDNDGWVDVIVARYKGPDLLLRNRGDGTFAPPVDAGFARGGGTPGDMVTAADLDGDGRLDVVVSEGSWYERAKSWGPQRGRGWYRIMRNTTPKVGNYLLVRVGNSPRRRATSLHAVVTLTFRGEAGVVMARRVGNPGTAVSVSYIETVHFGLGRRARVGTLRVRWTSGEVRTLRDVAANRKYTVGRV